VNLVDIGLRGGERVRHRRRDDRRWQEGIAVGVERDGSLGIRDAKGASRAIPLERVEVRTSGPRGGWIWESLAERAARSEQLELF
jgi:hypothetical protein